MRTVVAEGRSVQQTLLQDLRELNQAEAAQKSSRMIPSNSLDSALFLEDNFEIVFEGDQFSKGKAAHSQFGDIVCHKIEPMTSTPVALEIYLRIQSGAYVQRLYGLFRSHDNVYALMENLEGEETLSHAIQAKTLPENLVDRLQLASDVAKSMAWYHRAEMLLKSITDDNIVLKRLPSGRRCCVMTGLQSARHVSFSSSAFTSTPS